VTLEGDITVTGGQEAEVDISNVASGTFVVLTAVRDACGATDGFVLNAVDTVFFTQQTATGFPGAGIRVSDITKVGQRPLWVIGNVSSGNAVGISVEYSLPNTVRVEGNRARGNSVAGIRLVDSEGVLIDGGNKAINEGMFCTVIDAQSDGNVIERNRALGNTFDLANLGRSGNCFEFNHYETHEGDISCSGVVSP
jgi:parallel beta-helix repeat protein